MPYEGVEIIQDACRDVFPLLGYQEYENAEAYNLLPHNFWDTTWDQKDVLRGAGLL